MAPDWSDLEHAGSHHGGEAAAGDGQPRSRRRVKRTRGESTKEALDGVRAKAALFSNLVLGAAHTAATTKGRDTEERAWAKYVAICEREFWSKQPSLRNKWPLPVREWTQMLTFLRAECGSYGAFTNMLNVICKVGTKLAHNAHVAQCVQKGIDDTMVLGVRSFDPRLLYSLQNRATKDILRREYAVEVAHTEYISMEEARNGHKFTDHKSLPGLQESAVWNMENLSGGRRPRSLADLRVRHLTWRVTAVVQPGEGEWRVPSLSYRFEDEKFMDKRGPRGVSEDFSFFADFARDGNLSSACYLYALFKARGLFVDRDPLRSLRPGENIRTHTWAQNLFVFCHMEGDTFFDCVPLSPAAISRVTRNILRRMGRKVRGARAHRHGAFTRPQVMNLMQQRGVGLDPSVGPAVHRAAGWSVVHGPTTTATTYESVLLDRSANSFGLFLGVNLEPEVWQLRYEEWLGKDIDRTEPIRHPHTRGELPFIARLRGLHAEEVEKARRHMNTLGVNLLHEGLYGTCRVVLVERECCIHDVWLHVLQQAREGKMGPRLDSMVREYDEAVLQYRAVCKESVDAERHMLVAAYVDWCDVEGRTLGVQGPAHRYASDIHSDRAALVRKAAAHTIDVALMPIEINRALHPTTTGGLNAVRHVLHFLELPYQFTNCEDGK